MKFPNWALPLGLALGVVGLVFSTKRKNLSKGAPPPIPQQAGTRLGGFTYHLWDAGSDTEDKPSPEYMFSYTNLPDLFSAIYNRANSRGYPNGSFIVQGVGLNSENIDNASGDLTFEIWKYQDYPRPSEAPRSGEWVQISRNSDTIDTGRIIKNSNDSFWLHTPGLYD